MDRLQLKSKRLPHTPSAMFGMAPADILEDILLRLVEENEYNLEHLSAYAGFFKHPKVIEVVFMLSELWCQDSSTKYHAVEILDRFMVLHVQQLFRAGTEKKNSAEIATAWAAIKSSLCDRFLLYLVACIQIASKLHFLYQSVKSTVAIQFLRSAGYSYKKEDLLNSEMTVLKTLNFQINIQSPFSYVETLLEVLGFNGCCLPLTHVGDMCVKVLDLVYLLKNPIYDTVLKATVDLSTPSESQRSKFLALKEDLMLLATGVIAASSVLINWDSQNQVMEHLSTITGITVNSVSEMCSAILKHSMGANILS